MGTTTTKLLEAASGGDSAAQEALIGKIYEELRGSAHQELRHWPFANSLQTTALVHEVYLRLIRGRGWKNRQHFLRAAATAMHRFLIDLHRRETEQSGETDALRDYTLPTPEYSRLDLQALERHLEDLSKLHTRQADVLRARYFLGLSISDLVCEFDLSKATVERDLAFARAWMYERMSR
jgi:RNA polymerase sigma factor (TIGR02999 family)